MNKEQILAAAGRAGLKTDRMGVPRSALGSVGFLPQGLDRQAWAALQSLEIWEPNPLGSKLPKKGPQIEFWGGQVFAPLGSRTAARRFIRELRKMAFVALVRATQGTSSDAGLAGQI